MIGALLATTGAVAGACGAGWAAMDPQSQLYGATLVRRRDAAGQKLLALTYDDGPNDPHTGRLLDVLARENVRATFFMIGRYAAVHAGIARLVASAGHEIGNHTASHPNLIFRTATATQQELAACERSLADAVGAHSALFRPPFGGRRPSTLRAARRAGLTTAMWSVSGKDWKLDARGIEQQLLRHVRGGEIILLHDGGDRAFGADRSATVAATAAVIPQLRDEGYQFVSVGEMFP
jgi:peptidoglycan/xylan/chitin deacetylase (PgdA/CDA1 family)